MLTKQQVLDAIERMPDSFDVTDLFDRIVLLKKIDEGRQNVKEGKVFTTEEAKEKLGKWLE